MASLHLEHLYRGSLGRRCLEKISLIVGGLHPKCNSRCLMLPDKRRIMWIVCTVRGPHRHVAVRDWFFFNQIKKIKK